MAHTQVPHWIILAIKSFSSNFKCRMGNNESNFGVKTGLRQGCPMLALLFNLTIDRVMWHTTSDWPWGIRWTLSSTLQDLDFCQWPSAGLTHSSAHARENHPSQHVCTTSRPEDQPKEDTSDDVECSKPLMTGNREDLLITKEFTYLSNTIRYDGWAGRDIRNHLNKARKVFRNLNKPYKSSQHSTKTRL